MSEEPKGVPKGTVDYEKVKNIRCELVSGEDVSFLEGKLKTFLESLGLTNKDQESASRQVLTIILWDWFNSITHHRTDHLSEKRKWYKTNILVIRDK